jgi:hypothetical protein
MNLLRLAMRSLGPCESLCLLVLQPGLHIELDLWWFLPIKGIAGARKTVN